MAALATAALATAASLLVLSALRIKLCREIGKIGCAVAVPFAGGLSLAGADSQ